MYTYVGERSISIQVEEKPEEEVTITVLPREEKETKVALTKLSILLIAGAVAIGVLYLALKKK
ncbi:MAG TPA: hypothetical protein ENF25_02780 [Thermoprotei archaeon]|nr:hypothetical protein [Thermoprotei archaeon]